MLCIAKSSLNLCKQISFQKCVRRRFHSCTFLNFVEKTKADNICMLMSMNFEKNKKKTRCRNARRALQQTAPINRYCTSTHIHTYRVVSKCQNTAKVPIYFSAATWSFLFFFLIFKYIQIVVERTNSIISHIFFCRFAPVNC